MKKTRILYYFVLVISLGLLFYSSYKIILWAINNKKTTNQIKKVQDVAEVTFEKKEDDTDSMRVKFDELLNMNEETVGWINVPGTAIDYSVVKHEDNDYYLYHSFDKTYNGSGWIYLDYRSNLENLDRNTVIYGHSMINKTMFGTLRNVVKDSYFEEIKEHYIYLSTPKYNFVFEIFSAYHLDPTDDYIQVGFRDESEFETWLNLVKNRTMVDYGTTVTKDDKILTLSTCWTTSERMAVHSKLIKMEKVE